MFSLDRILIPIDFTERCVGAASYAISLAERFNSEINLLHVFSPHAYNDDDMGIGVTMSNGIAERRTKAQTQLDEFLNAALHHLHVKRTLLDGDPAQKIVELALGEHPDLIMMPTRGHGSFRRLLQDSVTVKVLHGTDRRFGQVSIWRRGHPWNGVFWVASPARSISARVARRPSTGRPAWLENSRPFFS